MIVYFADRNLDILGNASTRLPDGFRVSDDLTTEEIDTGVNTFSCVISYTQDDRADLEPMVAEGNYILKQSKKSDDYDSVYQIIEVECDTESQEYQIYAEDAGLDLLNTLCPAVTLTGTIGSMIQYFLPSDWSINLMDVPTTSKTNTWDGESTCTERLLSVANLWGCEIYYSFVIEGLQVKERVVNVIEKRGNQEAIPQLRLNYDLKKIYWKKSIANLVTAIKVTGGTPQDSNTPINLVNYNYSYTDPVTGDVYKVDKATGQMRNVTAMAKWSSAIDPDGLWVGSFEYDTLDKPTLAGQARAYLQRHSQVEVNYEVDFEKLPDDVQIGDRVNIIDENGELYLEARLLRIETCEAEDTQTATIGEYLLRGSGISDRVAQLASDLANARATDKVIQSQMQIITDTVDSLYTLEVDSDVVLGVAHLTARLLNGKTDAKTNYDPSWFKWILRSDEGERLLGRGYTIDVDMNIIGYASTILCKFIRPQLYDLTDHNLNVITDANSDPIQVSFAGIYNQPTVRRNLLKSRILRATTETGDPTLAREVNLYEEDGLNKALASTLQYFWTEESGDDAGAHITEKPKDEFLTDPKNGGGNLLARTDGITIRNGLTDLASFKAEKATLGTEEGTHLDITPRSMNLKAGNGESYAFMGLDNGADGLARIVTHFSASTATILNSSWHIVEIADAVYSDGTDATVTIGAGGNSFIITDRKNLVLSISYTTDTPAPYYTFGTRKTGRYGYFSVAIGNRHSVASQSSACVGGANNTIRTRAGNSAIIGGESNTIGEGAGNAVVAGGYGATATGNGSFAHGNGVTANGNSQTVLGVYNIEQGEPDSIAWTDHAFIIGNGTANARSNAMAVTWAGNVTIAGTLTQSSDKQLKDHIEYLGEDACEFIRKLKPAHYTKNDESHVGFYAQDVEAVDKWDCMTGEMNGYKTLGYTELIAPLVAYCQRLEKRIEELEKGKK